jgi:23S rRNA pseudouridine1911/1915/1917 synthase
VQRLDKQTSGVLLVAKSGRVHTALAVALASTETCKQYLAVCYGRLTVARRRLRLPLGRDPFDRRRVIVRADGADAITEVTRIANARAAARGIALVGCRLLTGRTHQIRVHLRAANLPIVGDPVYGRPGWRDIEDVALARRCREFPRQALHAWRLDLMHPMTGRPLALEAPLPADLEALIDAAGLHDRIAPERRHAPPTPSGLTHQRLGSGQVASAR